MNSPASGISQFSCRIDNVKTIAFVVQCLMMGKRDNENTCHIDASNDGLLFVAHAASKAVEARVNCPVELFEEFECRSASGDANLVGVVAGELGTNLKFCVNLKLLLDCLHLFGSAMELSNAGGGGGSSGASSLSSGSATKSTTNATLSYDSEDAIFRVSLEESGVITMCELHTLLDDALDVTGASSYGGVCTDTQTGVGASDLFNSFRSHPVAAQIIARSEPLKDLVGEALDTAGSETLCVRIRPGRIVFCSRGSLDSCDIELTDDSSTVGHTMFVSFVCHQPCVEHTYSAQSMQTAMRPCGVAKETYLRINSEGILCVQHQLEANQGGIIGGGSVGHMAAHDIFVDYLLVPKFVVPGEEEGGGSSVRE